MNNTLRIHITGASGSGTTTLGRALADTLECRHLDTDTYFWTPTHPPYQKSRAPEERLGLLLPDLQSDVRWILSGSLCRWGEAAVPYFDLVIFLYIPTPLRLERLERREREDFGDAILPGGSMHTIYTDFIEWAARYDTAGTEQRSLALHEQWMATLPCPVLRLEGDMTVTERVRTTLDTLQQLQLERL